MQDSRKHDNSHNYNSTGAPVGYMEGDLQAAASPELKSTQDITMPSPTGTKDLMAQKHAITINAWNHINWWMGMNLAGWLVPWPLTSPSGPLQSIELFHPLSSFELLQASKQAEWCLAVQQDFMSLRICTVIARHNKHTLEL